MTQLVRNEQVVIVLYPALLFTWTNKHARRTMARVLRVLSVRLRSVSLQIAAADVQGMAPELVVAVEQSVSAARPP